MEHRALAALMLRIAGLLLIVWALADAGKSLGPFVVQPRGGFDFGLVAAGVLFGLAMPVGIGLVLLYFPGTLTTRVLRIPGIESPRDGELPAYERVAFAVMGLWWVLDAILDALYVYARSRLYLRFMEDQPAYVRLPALTPDDFASLVVSAAQLLIGLWLMLGNRGLAGLLYRIRTY
jgi:hypothetical protein